MVALLRNGISKRGVVFGPMAQVVHDSLQYITEADTQAMAVYLKSLAQPGAPERPDADPPDGGQSRAAYEAGAKLYDTHCKACHGATARACRRCIRRSPTIRRSTWTFSVNPIRMVLFGGFPPSTRGNPRPFGMPPFAYTLTDQEVAEVVTYMRQSWGNRGTAR